MLRIVLAILLNRLAIILQKCAARMIESLPLSRLAE
jgi:hypothetical protein